MIRIEMLSTGDEVLYGQILDTNAAWLSDYLFQQGFSITSRVTIGDNLAQLVAVLKDRTQHNDVLIINGGLGPTSDDLTAEGAAIAVDEPLVKHSEWVKVMQAYFSQRGRTMPSSNIKQAMLPKSATIVDNPIGTACGFMMEINHCLCYFTPGVPVEFKLMVQEQILPTLQQRYPAVIPSICYRLTTMGRSESDIAAQLDSQIVLPENVQIGYRSAMPIIELKLTGLKSAQPQMDLIWQQIKQLVQENTLYEGVTTLAHQVSHLLTQQNKSLIVLENYTAGLVTYQLKAANAPLAFAQICDDIVITAKSMRQSLSDNQADIILAIGEYCLDSKQITISLTTESKHYHYVLKYTSRPHQTAMMHDIFATVAQDILLRYLQINHHLQGNDNLVTPNMWLDVVKL